VKRLSAYCRRQAAVHEAGHAIAAARFGLMAETVRIWPVENPQPGQTLWQGEVYFPGIEKQPVDARRVIGIAGAAAEALWLKILPEDVLTMTKGFISESDWQIIGRVAGGPSNIKLLSLALKEATAIIERERKFLLELSRRLIIESRTTALVGR
jgi:hypothetical protein